MKPLFVLVIFLVTYSLQYELPKLFQRNKREAAGTLDIVSSDSHPIHTDIKTDTSSNMVIPPTDVVYEPKSLRKSLPAGSTLDLVRATSRVVTLVTLVCAAAVEVYPLVYNLYKSVHEYFGVQ